MKYQKTYKMKTSELIKMLQEKLQKNGDLEVRLSQDENQYDDMGDSVPCGAVITIIDKDKPCYEIVMTSWEAAEMN